jgi:hypothetical protein
MPVKSASLVRALANFIHGPRKRSKQLLADCSFCGQPHVGQSHISPTKLPVKFLFLDFKGVA